RLARRAGTRACRRRLACGHPPTRLVARPLRQVALRALAAAASAALDAAAAAAYAGLPAAGAAETAVFGETRSARRPRRAPASPRRVQAHRPAHGPARGAQRDRLLHRLP